MKNREVADILYQMAELLELQAAWRDEGDRRECIQDLKLVSYIPSTRALANARRIASTAATEKLLAIDEPMTSFYQLWQEKGMPPSSGPGAGPKGAESAREVSASVLLGCLLYDRSMIRISRVLAKKL